MKTKVITDEKFNNKNQFKIFQVDDNGEKAVEFDKKTGEKKVKKPMFNFGIVKVKVILASIPELQQFVKDQESKS